MNYRKMMLVAFLLLAVLTLGAVSASEDADVLAADSVDEVSVDASLDDEIISEGGGDSLASSDDSSALGWSSENFDIVYQTHEAVSKQEDEVLHVWWHDVESGTLCLRVYDSDNNLIYVDGNDDDGYGYEIEGDDEFSWTVSDLFSDHEYPLGYYTLDLDFDEVNIIDDLQFQLTYCNIEEYRDESVYIDYPFDVIRIYERTEVLEVYVNNVKIDNERNYDDGPTAWNLTELDITQPGIYNIIINATNPNLGHVETFVMTLNVTGYDPDKWRVFTNYEGIHDFDENDPVIYLYCANEDTQNIVAIAPNEVWSYRDSVTGAMLSWTLSDLGIEENGDYKIYIGNGFDNVVPPVWINVWHMDDNGEEDEDWILDYNSDLITFRHLVMLSDRYDSGRLEINDSDGNVLFNRSVYEMEPNYDMMGYKYDQYDGYVVFKEDLNTNDTGVYDLTITYYDDENEIVESVNTTVCLDYDSYVTDEEIDITDYNSTLFSIHVFEDVMNDGQFEIELIAGEDDDEYPYISHNIDVEEVAGDTLDITMQNYTLPEGVYSVYVRYISNDDDPDDHYVQYWKYNYFHDRVTIVDNTKFRVRMESDSLLDENSQFLVFCPEGSAGKTIIIEVALDGYSNFFEYDITEDDEYKSFALDLLNITAPGRYEFNLYDEDNESLIDTYCYEFDNPIRLREMVIIGADDIFDSAVVYVIVPEGTQGEVVIKDDEGNQLFYMDSIGYLRLVTDREQVDYQFEDEPLKRYYVINDDLTAPQQDHSFNNTIFKFGLDAGTYYLTATLTTGGKVFTSSEEVRFVERNYVERNGVRIELFDYEEHRFCDEEDRIAKVTAEQYGDYDPSTDNPRIEVNLIGEEYDNIYTFYLDEDDGAYSVSIWIDDEELAPGLYEVIVWYYFTEDCDEPLELTSYITFVGHDDEDGPLEEIEFNMVNDEDGESIFEKGDDVTVAYLLIPESQNDDANVTITVTRNGQPFATIRSTEIEPEYIESREAYQYPINLDLTQLEDKDLLEFNINCFDEGDEVLPYGIEVNDNEVIFNYYLGIPEFYVFYGNITTRDLNNPEMMGPRPNGDFIEFSVPDAYNVSEGGIVVSDGDTVILNKSFDDFEEVGYDYSVLGNAYTITLDEFDLMSLPENSTITVSLNYGSDSLTFKRIRVADYVYKLVTPDDVAILYDVEITDDVISNIDDVVVSIVALDANRQSIYIDIGGGHFSVYVNGVKVENLGEKLLYAWIYQSGILDVDELSEDDDYYWQLNEMEIDIDEYLNSDIDDRVSMLYDIAVDEFGSELELFRMTSYNMGCPELYLSAADLGITESGTYLIEVTHIPDSSEPEELEPGEIPPDDYVVHEETLVLEKNLTVTMTDRIDTTISASKLNTVYGSGDEFVATLKDANGNPIGGADLTISLGDINITVVTGADGKARLDVTAFTPKVYYATIYFAGDSNYNPSVKESVKVYVQKISTILTSADVSGLYHNGTRLVATLKDANGNALSGEKVTFTIDGKNWDATTNSKGVVRFLTDRLEAGNYTANIAFKATAYYYASSTTANIVIFSDKVNTTLSASKLITVYGSGDEFVVTLKDVDGNPIGDANVIVNLGDVNVTVVTGADGKARLDVTTFTPKVYYANIYFMGDSNYNPSVKESVKVYVQKISTILTSADVSGLYHNGTRLVATLKDANGNALSGEKVTFTIDGKKWDATTNSKGVVRFLTDRLEAGNYTANIAFKATAYYYASSITANIVIFSEKVNTTLSASKLITVYGSGDEFVVTLKDANGNPIGDANVIVNLGDVNVTVVTGADGKARLDVTAFTPKVYFANIYFMGDSNYNPSVKENVKVYVQKISTALTCDDVSCAYHSGTRLVATLKDANGNALSGEKVTITIDGKKWDVTTNSNGQVRFLTDRLDVGNYTAEISYKASTYYYASSTTANIVIV